MSDQSGLLPGTLDLLILKAVSLGKLHGYGVLLRIGEISGGAPQIQQGALYPALYRLEHQGLISSEWGTSENNRKAKYYQITDAGRRRLDSEAALEPDRRGDRQSLGGDAAGGPVIAQLRSLWRGLRKRSAIETDMQDEFRTHIEMRTDDLVRSGLSPAKPLAVPTSSSAPRSTSRKKRAHRAACTGSTSFVFRGST